MKLYVLTFTVTTDHFDHMDARVVDDQIMAVVDQIETDPKLELITKTLADRLVELTRSVKGIVRFS